jgi:hypothetical protein
MGSPDFSAVLLNAEAERNYNERGKSTAAAAQHARGHKQNVLACSGFVMAHVLVCEACQTSRVACTTLNRGRPFAAKLGGPSSVCSAP